MTLRPAGPQDAPAVAGWVTDPVERRMWCGLDEVTAATVAGWAAQPDVLPYGLVADGELVGYGELWLDDEEAEVELARLVVAPDRRGRGLGRTLARSLAAEALRHQDEVILRVHPDNARALRCYLAAGFGPIEDAAAWNAGQPVAYVWLRLLAETPARN